MGLPEYDLCVIGGGAAGLVVAAGGATLGARVVLVEKHRLGGDCLYYGCVPSKALLHSAKVAHTLREAGRYGIAPAAAGVEIPAVLQRVTEVIREIEPNDSPERFRGLGVEVVFGAARFTGPASVQVNGRAITARKFVIATGSRPAVPPIPGLADLPYLTNETVFSLSEPVPSLIVLGAGPIGVEMAQAFARLGSRVALVEVADRVLPREDADLADVVARRLAAEGVAIHAGAKPLQAEGRAGAIRLLLNRAGVGEHTLEASHFLVAAGRALNLEGLGLEAAGVAVENGRIAFDQRLRTTNRKIYVCGDAAGPHLFTHMAEHQAGVVLRNALFHWPAKVEQRVVPWCTFTDPELARVGLSEGEARASGVACQVYTFPFADIDRAHTDGALEGLAKILTDRSGCILGAAIVGSHAGELIHEYALAMAQKLKAKDLSAVIHVYPTLAQINRRVADQRLKQALTPRTKKWIRRIFRLRGPQ